jgi:RNA polymerase sigma-70 factor (ECF subfamily)
VASDLELLDAWRAGDNAAGDQLFDRYFDPVYRFFRHKTSGDVDDLVQKAFLAAAEARSRLRDGSSFRSYIYACARNVLCRHLQGVYRGAAFDPAATSLEAVAGSPSELVADREELRLLQAALRRLPLDDQVAVELFYWEGLSGAEIATVLDLPEGTVRTRLRRARLALADHMRELQAPAALVTSTLEGLEGWAEAMREQA